MRRAIVLGVALGSCVLLAPAAGARELARGYIYGADLARDRAVWVQTDWDVGTDVIYSARAGRRSVVRRLPHGDPDAPQWVGDLAASGSLIGYERADEEDTGAGPFTRRRELVVVARRRTVRLRRCTSRYIDGNLSFGIDVSGRRVVVGGASCRRRGGLVVLDFSRRGRIVRRTRIRFPGPVDDFELAGRFLAVESDHGVNVIDVRTQQRVTRPARTFAGYDDFALAPDGTLALLLGYRGHMRVGFQAPGERRARLRGARVTGSTIAATATQAAILRPRPPHGEAAEQTVEVLTVGRDGRTRVQASYRPLGIEDEVVGLESGCLLYRRDRGASHSLHAVPLRPAPRSPACPG